jgi:2-C-methyl-D-erythritol 4-phosphate cytidylyltransferase
VVAAPPGHEEELAKAGQSPAVVVTGADSRSGSVASALTRVETEIVVVHDAARPLAPAGLFDAVVAELAGDEDADAVIAATPVADTLKRAADDLVVSETLDRSGLWAIQTPQAFRTDALRDALSVDQLALDAATDDAMLVEEAGGKVLLHSAPAWNLKVTAQDDVRMIEALLAQG